VQLFISDLLASFTPDVKRLRGFEKVNLKAGESKTVSFKVPVKELAFVGTDNKKHLEQGDFKIQIADQSSTFNVTKTVIF
jgi:beta-glucosidase